MRARHATRDDAPEVVRLARVMFESMGLSVDGQDWSAAAEAAVASRLGSDVMAVVVDDPRNPGRLASSGAVSVHRRLPRPGSPDFVAGYVQWVATDPVFRGQGLARAVMIGLVDWARGQGATVVELHATPMAEHLYESLGFSDSGPRALRVRDLGSWVAPY